MLINKQYNMIFHLIYTRLKNNNIINFIKLHWYYLILNIYNFDKNEYIYFIFILNYKKYFNLKKKKKIILLINKNFV